MTKTFEERCHIAQQFLPDAQYKAMLTALHTEMLAKLAEQPAQQQIASTITITQRGSTRTIDNHFEDCVRDWPDGEYKLYTTPQAQPAPAAQQELDEYDAGLLAAGGGGDVEWWRDYIRAELGRAYEHYQCQMTAPQAQPAPEIAIADAYRAGVDSGIAAEREACAKEAESWDCHLAAAEIRLRSNT